MRTAERRRREVVSMQDTVAELQNLLFRLEQENARLTRRTAFLQLLADSRSLVANLRAGHLLSGPSKMDPLQLHSVDIEAIKHTTCEQYHQRYLEFVRTAALLLPHCSPNGDPCLAGELCQLTLDHHRFAVSMIIWNPKAIYAAKSMPLHSGWPAALPQHHAAHVMSKLDWSGAQAEAELACMAFRWHVQQLERISDERAALSAQLSAATAAGDTLREEDVVAGLALNVEEFAQVNAVAALITTCIVPPWLCATSHVVCYPFFPVAAAFAKAFLEQHGTDCGGLCCMGSSSQAS